MDQLSFDLDGPAPLGPRPKEPQAAEADPALRLPPASMPEPDLLEQSLVRLLEGRPPGRTFLVGRTRGEGRELLRRLALRGFGWAGIEPTTLRPLALELTAAELAAGGLRVLDDLEQEALVEASLDGALQELEASPWRAMAEGVGFREAVGSTVATLRLAGIRSDRVAGSSLRDPHRRELLATVLRGYEEGLRQRNAVDTAALLERAVRRLEGDPDAPGGRVILLPGLGMRGVAGRLVRALLRGGAEVPECDAVRWMHPPPGLLWSPAPAAGLPGAGGGAAAAAPTAFPFHPSVRISLFRAAGIAEELREVIRRVLAAGVPFDQVEIIAADPVAYGSALHAIAASLNIPVSFGVGLPVERTRPGRMAVAWCRWVEGGFPADVIRELLEAGELAPPQGGPFPDGMRLARRLRLLRIGWGWGRYLPVLDAARRGADGPPLFRKEESEEEALLRQARFREEVEGLRAFLAPVLEAIPPGLRRGPGGAGSGEPTSPARLAAALGSFLAWARPGDGADASALQRLRSRLDRVAATLQRETDPASALRILRRQLRLRVPAPDARGGAPWVASGGYLHLTDLEHGGATGRPMTFLVGVDADRFGFRAVADPLLPDPDRRVLSPELPTGGERAREAAFRVGALLARLRGRVTLSWAAWSAAEGRENGPASLFLRSARQAVGDPGLGYDALPALLGPVKGRVATSGDVLLDRDDAWLAALSLGPGVLRDGVEAVRRGVPGLEEGVAARRAWGDDDVGPRHGRVRPLPQLDPREDPSRAVSPSALEALGSCPLKYLYRDLLGIRPPMDPVFDPDRWLDPLHRGSLLHRVFEQCLRVWGRVEAGAEQGPLLARGLQILEEEAQKEAWELPPPGPAVYAREMEQLRQDLAAFVSLVSREGAPWEALELRFGLEGDPPLRVEVEGGSITVQGAVDRVDRGSGGLEIIDYKTGSARRFAEGTGTYHGGRRLQHLLYVLAVERLRGEPVERMTYLFPGRTGRNERQSYPRGVLRGGEVLLGRLLDLVREGRFLPTDTPDDCRFCDYRPVCRVKGEGDRTASPPAEWTAARLATEPELAALRALREWEGGRPPGERPGTGPEDGEEAP